MSERRKFWELAGLEVVAAREYEANLEEGRGHAGPSAVIDFIARKPR